MKAQPSSLRIVPELTMLSTWTEQLAQAAPGASRTLMEAQPQLLSRFAAYYSKLQQLPRRVRRDLQRRFRRVRPRIGVPVSEYGAGRGRRAHPLFAHGTPPTRIQSLAGVALLLALGQAPALASTINVRGGCTLVDAITAANTNNAIGLCRAGRGADRLVLTPSSTHTLTTANNSTPYGPTGLPVVTSTITIAGNGSIITRAIGAPAFRILAVSSTGNLTIQRTTVNGGAAGGSDRIGGGVFNRGKLTLSNSIVSGNSAALSGGGVYTGYGSVTLTNTTVAGNRGGAGGGVHTYKGTAILTNSTVFGNKVVTAGGGLYSYQSAVTVTNSTIAGNSAFHGGGISTANVGESRVNLTNSTVSGNSATRYGGGIDNGKGTLTLTSSTVSGNSAGIAGGGVFGDDRNGNVRSDVVLSRSLVSGNVATFGTEIYQLEGGVVTSTGFNLFGHNGRIKEHALAGRGLILTSQSDIIATGIGGNRPTALASILSPTLANNGGPTQTHALVPGSPAIEGAGSCPTKDQRGVARPQDGDNDGFPICDIGAFERTP